MLTKEQALHYSEQLHPAFAGYLHDGIVSERDAIALIMYFVQKSFVTAQWQDDSLCKNIKSIKKTTKVPTLDFDKKVLNELFSKSDTLSSKDIKNLITSGLLKKLILGNLQAIQTFPIIYNDIKFNHGDDVFIPFLHRNRIIDTFSEIKMFERDSKLTAFAILLITIVLLIPTNDFVDIPRAIMGERPIKIDAITVTLFALIFAYTTFYYSYISSKKQVEYQFYNEVVPIAQKKYAELYDFLSNYPLENHNIVNEFLPYSIAFGIDKSWLGDFGLSAEPKIESSPLIDY